MAAKVYVWGTDGNMKAETEPPRRSKGFDHVSYGWKSLYFRPGRGGILQEWKSKWDGRHVYIREVPAEMVEEVLDAELEVQAAEEALKAARANRQLVLKAAAVRGARVKVEDAVDVEPSAG